ncbi:MAG: hypothetical protein ACJZ9B_01560 [Coraliomargaritaceae bacterium]
MIQALVKLYHQRSLREKFLLQGFILVLFVIWSQSFLGKVTTWNNQRQSASIELMTQQQWLDREIQYAEALTIALEKVEPEKTFSAAQLSGQVDALIRSIKLEGKTDIDPVQTRISEIFNDHTMRLRLKGINIQEFITLNDSLKSFSPYIAPKSIRITKNQRRPQEMNIRFEINSFDLKQQSI